MEQRLIQSPQMIQAMQILQLPALELEERIEQELTEQLAKAGYIAMAVDMYGNGKQADHPDNAMAFMQAATRDTARAEMAEGLMLKRAASPYFTGRKRGDWWKWKLDPFSVDAVMIYAQAGHGRRASLYTDFTFAVRSGNDLVPFAKAYSGLTDVEFAEITKWVRGHTLERFGPVRRVEPELVFEIGFEGIQASPRHKSGIALRFPRMLRWRRDKGVAEIDTLDSLRALLAAQG